MKISILDAKTLGSDIDLNIFNQFGEVSTYETTTPAEIQQRLIDTEVIITNKVQLNEISLSGANKLKLICIAATGTNNVDLNYCKANNIAVTNVAGYSTDSVAQHTLAMALNLAANMNYFSNYVFSGEYARSDIFTHLGQKFYELKGKTWGIIGLGQIGKSVARLAGAIGCKVVYYSTSGKHSDILYDERELNDLLSESDIISIHSPLNDRTRNLIGLDQLRQMKKNALLINVGRGGIVKEEDLAIALTEGIVAGAGLDVLEAEPIKAYNPLLKLVGFYNLIITPHIAWASVEARGRLINEVASNISSFIKGEERNRV